MERRGRPYGLIQRGYRSVRTSPQKINKERFNSHESTETNGEADPAKSSCEVHRVTADGFCGGRSSLNNNNGGGLKLKRRCFESPDKQAKSGRIKETPLFFFRLNLQLLHQSCLEISDAGIFLFIYSWACLKKERPGNFWSLSYQNIVGHVTVIKSTYFQM